MADPKKPTRNQLAKFLPDNRVLKAVEKLFERVPADILELQRLVEESTFDANSARAAATQATDALAALAQLVELLAMRPVEPPPPPENDQLLEVLTNVTHLNAMVGRLAELVEGLLNAPPLGDMAQQSSGSVVVTGGNINARLRNNQATLLETTTTLTNGAAAAAGTLANAPIAGNPTKWAPINDNGTTRYVPLW